MYGSILSVHKNIKQVYLIYRIIKKRTILTVEGVT